MLQSLVLFPAVSLMKNWMHTSALILNKWGLHAVQLSSSSLIFFWTHCLSSAILTKGRDLKGMKGWQARANWWLDRKGRSKSVPITWCQRCQPAGRCSSHPAPGQSGRAVLWAGPAPGACTRGRGLTERRGGGEGLCLPR